MATSDSSIRSPELTDAERERRKASSEDELHARCLADPDAQPADLDLLHASASANRLRRHRLKRKATS